MTRKGYSIYTLCIIFDNFPCFPMHFIFELSNEISTKNKFDIFNSIFLMVFIIELPQFGQICLVQIINLGLSWIFHFINNYRLSN